jgi:hypothetical protein
VSLLAASVLIYAVMSTLLIFFGPKCAGLVVEQQTARSMHGIRNGIPSILPLGC